MPEDYSLIYTGPQIDRLLEKIDGLTVATQSSSGLMSNTDKTKLDNLEAGGEVNVLEGIRLNGTLAPISNKIASLTVIVPSKVSDLANDSGFISNTVSNLTNYYSKNETYTKSQVDNMVAGLKPFTYQTVQTLPTASASTMYIIYLVPSAQSMDRNIRDEFITIQDGNTYKWEQIGSTAIEVDSITDAEIDALFD